jgi:hypothetical protein
MKTPRLDQAAIQPMETSQTTGGSHDGCCRTLLRRETEKQTIAWRLGRQSGKIGLFGHVTHRKLS